MFIRLIKININVIHFILDDEKMHGIRYKCFNNLCCR